MTIKDNQRFRKLQGQQCYGMCPSNIDAMMTGAIRAQQTKTGEVTLYYSDGTTEKATLTVDLDSLENGWFGVVSAVQSIARA